MLRTLFSLVVCLSPAAWWQEPQPSPATIETLITDLASPDASLARAARLTLAEFATLSRGPLEARFTAIAPRVDRESFPHLIEIMATFRAMGPDATDSLSFLTAASGLVGGSAWDEWKQTDRSSSSKSWNELWSEMIHAIGATGRAGLEELLAGARAEATTEQGVPYEHILWCIVPEGEDSLRTIVELAVDIDLFRARWGRSLVEHAGGPVGDLLSEKLATARGAEARKLVDLARRAMPRATSALIAALAHQEVDVRRAAIAGIASWGNEHLLDPSEPEYRNYVEWHGRLYEDPQKPFETLEEIRGEPLQSSVVRSLADPDAEVRAMSAFVLYRVAVLAPGTRTALERAVEDGDEATSFWAGEALLLQDDPPVRALQALAELPPRIDVDAEERDRLADLLWVAPAKFLASAPADAPDDAKNVLRLEAVAQVARTQLTVLLEGLRSEDSAVAGEARVRVGAMEAERVRRCLELCRLQDQEIFGQGPASDELRHLGAAAQPELIAEYMQEPRFSVGPSSYADIAEVLGPMGEAAIPLYGEALLHWREGGREIAAGGLAAFGQAAIVALPVVVAALRLEAEDDPEALSALVESGAPWSSLLAAMGAPARPKLESLLSDPHPFVRAAAAHALIEGQETDGATSERARSVLEQLGG